MNILVETAFAQLIRDFMELPNDHVWVRNQNKVIPTDNGLYVAVGRTTSRPFGTSKYLIEVDGVLSEVIRVQSRDSILIDIFSAGNDALERQWELIAALRSTLAQQIQEANYFKIGAIPASLTNTSSAEGGSQINRFSLIVDCITWNQKTVTLPQYDYYDNFTTRGDDSRTISQSAAMVEFNINAADDPYPPSGYSLVVDIDGNFLKDAAGNYIIALTANNPYPPEGFSLIVDGNGNYVTDGSGAYLIY